MTSGVDVVAAGDVGEFRGGSAFPPRYQGRKSGDLPFFKVSDMNTPGNEVFMTRANNYISEAERKAIGAVKIPANAIVFAKVGAAVFLERKRIVSQDSCIDNNMAAFIVDSTRLNVPIAHYLLSEFRMSSLVATTALPSLNNRQLRSIPLRIPGSIPAQEQIARVLSDVEASVSSLERLVKKEEAVRLGAMQELLSGRTRLPGYKRPWEQVRVGELLAFKNGLNKSSEFFGEGTPIVNFMDVMAQPIIQGGELQGRVTLTRDEIKRYSARAGDLFFTRTSESVSEIGTTATLLDDVPDATFSGFVLRGRPRVRNVDPRFLTYQFQMEAVRAQVVASASYTTRALTNGGSLGRVVVGLPTVEEQRAIAGVIVDLDLYLASLKARLSKMRDVRRGAIQRLLSAPVPVPAESVA